MVIPALRISSDFIQGSDIRVAPMASTGIGFRRDDSSFVKIGVRVVSEAHGVTILPFSEMDLAAPSGWILSVYLPDHVTATKQIKERMKTGVKALYQINYSDITGLNDRYKMQGKHFATEMFLDWMPNKKALIAILAGYQWVSEYTSTQYAGNRKNNDSPSVKPGIIKANSVYCGVSVKFFSPERKNENPD